MLRKQLVASRRRIIFKAGNDLHDIPLNFTFKSY